jgi:hypothetical protein
VYKEGLFGSDLKGKMKQALDFGVDWRLLDKKVPSMQALLAILHDKRNL